MVKPRFTTVTRRHFSCKSQMRAPAKRSKICTKGSSDRNEFWPCSQLERLPQAFINIVGSEEEAGVWNAIANEVTQHHGSWDNVRHMQTMDAVCSAKLQTLLGHNSAEFREAESTSMAAKGKAVKNMDKEYSHKLKQGGIFYPAIA